MKLFGWVQNKLSGKPLNKKPNTVSALTTKQEAREEFSDWPQGLLAIGTFGNNEIKQESTCEENPSSSSEELEIVDFTAEEVGNLQKELTKLLTRKSNKEKELAELPLDRFLNCPSSLEVDRRISNALINSIDDSESKSDYKKDEDNIDKTISVIIDKCKDICAKKNKKAIGKKSISFLLKKMLVCGSGFAPTTPSLKDSLQESRMEKLLKMMLLKKMNIQNSTRPTSSTATKYLEDIKQRPRRRINEDDDDDEKREKTHDGCKWVKTDSEYIVLEI